MSNPAAYLMMSDGRTSGITVKTWAEIFYGSMYNLTEYATFLQARESIVAVAKKKGFTGEQLQAIKDAFDTVGVVEPVFIRVVLTWGASPSDLDYDDRTAFGPEVVTIRQFVPGTYYFYVHNFSNRGTSDSTVLSDSGAKVQVYRGNEPTPINEFTVTQNQVGTYWNVFELTVGSDHVLYQ